MSGGKGGGSNTVNEYHGTIAGALGEGPAWSLEWIIMGGKTVWSGGLTRPEGADYSDIDLAGIGKARWYWGTETQMPDPDLNAYAEEPAFRGWVYIVLIDCSFGANGETNAPTIEIGWRRLPNQLIVSGSPAANDGACTSNPVASGAEILTSPTWGSLPASKINADSFQAVADDLQTEAVPDTNRVATSIAPLWNEQTDLKSALADIYSVSKVWMRIGVDGRIEAGRWKRNVNASSVTHLTPHDVDSERFETERADKLPNSFAVEFRDASKHHKSNVLTVDNTAAIRSTGLTRRQTAKRSLLIWKDQAFAHGSDLLRDSSMPKTTVTLTVRRAKAVNPDGTALRPGDYFTYNVEELGDTADTRLFRCIRRQFDPTGPITLIGEMENFGEVRAVPFDPGTADVTQPTAPINWARVMNIPQLVAEEPPCVTAFAARPSDTAFGFDVQYCASSGGDFASLGVSTTFALPLNLVTSLASGAGTIRVSLLPKSAGNNPQRDKTLLLNWNGGAGEAGLDSVLLCVVAKNGSGIVTGYEFLSVAGPASAVATDTYDVPVLRGRRGTTAQNFTSGSFPDSWTNYEVWCIPLSGLETFTHPDLEANTISSATAYFELIAFGQYGNYDPSAAWDERQRRAAASLDLAEFAVQADDHTVTPQIGYVMPLLSVPNNLTAVTGTGKLVMLNWFFSTVKSFGGEYGVYRATGPGFTDWAKIAEVSATRFVDNEVVIGTTYKYKIVAITPREVSSAYSNEATATPGTVGAGSLDPAVLAEIEAAQAAADAAQADADAANTQLANIASDSILSPVEKPQVILDYNVITSEQAGIDSKATAYGITTEKATYDNAVSALTTYLGTLTTPTAWSNTAGDTTIVPATFRTKFSDVYAARQALLNKINDHFGIPSNPAAPTLNAGGTYLSADGTVFSRIVINVPAMPNGAAVMNVLYRRTGTTGWVVGDQRSAGGGTSSIDDLTPGQQYDVAVQAFSNFGIASAIVTATGSPFTAPSKTTLPTAPSGFAYIGGANSQFARPPVYAGGVRCYCVRCNWNAVADSDFSHFEVVFNTSGASQASNDASWTTLKEKTTFPEYIAANLLFPGGEVYVRTVDNSGNKSLWVGAGQIVTYWGYPAGSMSEQNSNNVNMSGVQIGQSGGSITKTLAVYDKSNVVMLSGGAPTETFTVSLSGCGFTTKPDLGGSIKCEDPAMDVDAAYDFSNVSNSSAQAVIKVRSWDGSNIGAGYRRFGITLKQTF